LASRRIHLFGGTLFWGVFLGIFYALDVNTNLIDINFINSGGFHGLWIVLSFMVTHFGAQLPDYDLIWDKVLPHRNVLTHSVFLPLLLCIPLYWVNSSTLFLVPIYAFYLIGHASHLFFDLRPKSWKGTALIHIFWVNDDGRKTFPAKSSKLFLLINGIIVLVAGIILLYFFQAWI
jgi:hypothetical protein